eukprot:TRINITY_DN2952_c0_g1_i1.p1 TRINITY_DN2952_c0_g1~~TRINITY_DN2952_c0_g1_i1.p1  ORF type:complete len:397 (+),score=102.66 TRINITY_DN2952_c0_g1_i1:131-1321(+)
MAPPDASFNPFGHVVNYHPKRSISYIFDHIPVGFNLSQHIAQWKYYIPSPLRLDKNPRRNMFLWQRDTMAYYRHRKRLPWYFLLTWGANSSILFARAAAVQWRPQGDGILRSIRGALYSGWDHLDFQQFRPFHRMSLCFSRVNQTLPYSTAWNVYVAPRKVEGQLMSPEEIKQEKDLMKKIFTGDAECFEKKFRWYGVASADFLPVSNCPKTNGVAMESMMRGVEAVIQAKPLAECRKHFAVVEQLRYDALDKWGAQKPAPDGTYNLRFAFKALSWREKTLNQRIQGIFTRPWELGRYHEALKYIPAIGMLHWYSWHIFAGAAAGPFEDWKLRSNPDLLAEWGTLDDNRPFAVRKQEWKDQLAEEKKNGWYVYRNPGWLNGFYKYFKFESWFYFAE